MWVCGCVGVWVCGCVGVYMCVCVCVCVCVGVCTRQYLNHVENGAPVGRNNVLGEALNGRPKHVRVQPLHQELKA